MIRVIIKSISIFLMVVFNAPYSFGQTIQWFQTFETQNPINPSMNFSHVCDAQSGYWFSYIDKHQISISVRSYGTHNIVKFDNTGNIVQSFPIEGNISMLDMIEENNTLYMRFSVFDSIRINNNWLTNSSQYQNIFCWLDTTGKLNHSSFYGDSIAASTINKQGNIVFGTKNTFGGSNKFYVIDTSETILTVKDLQGIGDISDIREKSNGNGYIIGGSCLGIVNIDTISYTPTTAYTNYVMSFDSTLTAKWLKVIEDVTCPLTQVWSNDTLSYYSSSTSVIPDFDSLNFFGPNTMGADYFHAAIENNLYSWVKEVPGDTGWSTAQPSSNHALEVDGDGNSYLLGYQRGNPITWQTGLVTGNSINNFEIWLISYDPLGNIRWVKNYGGKGFDAGMDIAVSDVDELIISATINDTIDADGIIIPAQFGSTVVVKITDNITGIIQEEKSDQIKVFPNPTNGFISVQVPLYTDYTTYSILSIDGRLIEKNSIKKNNIRNRIEVNMSNLHNGIYYILLEGMSARSIEKVIILH